MPCFFCHCRASLEKSFVSTPIERTRSPFSPRRLEPFRLLDARDAHDAQKSRTIGFFPATPQVEASPPSSGPVERRRGHARTSLAPGHALAVVGGHAQTSNASDPCDERDRQPLEREPGRRVIRMHDEDRRPDLDVVEQPLGCGMCIRMHPCETRIAYRAVRGRAVYADTVRRSPSTACRADCLARRNRIPAHRPGRVRRIPPRFFHLTTIRSGRAGSDTDTGRSRRQRGGCNASVCKGQPVRLATDDDHGPNLARVTFGRTFDCVT